MHKVTTYVIGAVMLALLTTLYPLSADAQMWWRGNRSNDSDERLESSRRSNESFSGRRMNSSTRRAIQELGDDPIEELKIPIAFGVSVTQLYDSWGDARSNGRTHEGIDILAPKGAYIVSPTEAVVADIGYGENGGNYVYTYNPGGERFYFAHLDKVAEGLDEGDELDEGDLIGYVGNTGNAQGGAPHLHFTIYDRGAQNPFPRLTKEFTTRERIEILENMLEAYDDPLDKLQFAQFAVAQYASIFAQARSEGTPLSPLLTVVAGNISIAQTPLPQVGVSVGANAAGASGSFTRDLDLSDSGADVTRLQTLLITQNSGPAARALAQAGATGYFGAMTQAALAEYQAASGITPAIGYFGPVTRNRIEASQ